MASLPKFFTVTAVAGVLAGAVALVGVAGPTAAQTGGGCQGTSKAVLRGWLRSGFFRSRGHLHGACARA